MKYKLQDTENREEKSKESYMCLLPIGKKRKGRKEKQKEKNKKEQRRRKKTIKNFVALDGGSLYKKGIKQMKTKLNMGYF